MLSGCSPRVGSEHMHTEDLNFQHWASPSVSERWSEIDRLQPAEYAIFDSLEPWIRDARVLDLGVGGGRTAHYLMSHCAEYLGTDYSPAMVAACCRRFPDPSPHAVFQVADARALPFGNDSFDLAVFSYNGIDYVTHDDRLRVLSEVRRVLRTDGRFVFSTHNANWLRKFPGYQHADARTVALERNLDWLRIRLRNWRRDLLGDCCTVLEPPLETYYAAPGFVVRQLEVAGFGSIAAFGSADGRALSGAAGLRECADPWVYYCCTACC
jgi:SAM-dependent methyltransferase